MFSVEKCVARNKIVVNVLGIDIYNVLVECRGVGVGEG